VGNSSTQRYHDMIFCCRHSPFSRALFQDFLRKVTCHKIFPCVIHYLYRNQIQSTSSFLQCRSVSIHEISCLLLSGNYIAIALVDQDKLRSRLSLLFFFSYIRSSQIPSSKNLDVCCFFHVLHKICSLTVLAFFRKCYFPLIKGVCAFLVSSAFVQEV